jgi:hypothetical protein
LKVRIVLTAVSVFAVMKDQRLEVNVSAFALEPGYIPRLNYLDRDYGEADIKLSAVHDLGFT